MHPLFLRSHALTKEVINAAIEVHRYHGPGLLESVYEWCLIQELNLRNLKVENQRVVRIGYMGFCREEELRFDLLVESAVLVELKAVEAIQPIHKAQLMSYIKLLDIPLGLLINFNRYRLVDGVSRLILPGAGESN